MRNELPKRTRSAIVAAVAVMALAFAVVYASINVPGVTPFLELEVLANVGFDGNLGGTFDWANAGANAIPRDCPTSGGGLIQCSGSGGIFDGGKFNGATTPPTAPAETAAALADKTIVAAKFGVDPLSVDVTACGTGDPTVYTSVGSEVNGDDLNTETYATGSVPNKDEISNVYAISHQDPPNPPIPGPNDTNEIFAGFERVVNNGDSHVDLEFLQAATSLVPGSKPASFPCAGKFQGHRSQGDLLLSVDFTQGGTVGTPILHKWVCGDFPPGADKVCDPVKNPGKKTPPHYDQVSDQTTLAAVRQTFNATAPVGCGGWACRNADGTQTDSINTVELYEVGIDLAAVGFEGCISTFLPHTRSSQSFTATLKDFEVIQFNTCNPSTALTKSASASQIVTGDSVTYTYKEKNDGNVALTSPSVTDDKCSPVTYVSGDSNTNGNLDPAEEWTFTCTLSNITQDTTNTAVGHGTWTLGGQSVDVTYCTDPANPPSGVRCDQDERAQATVTVLNPSTTLTKAASPTVVTTVVYTYTEKNDGAVALSNAFVEDAQCTSHGGTISFAGGDNGNGVLDPGETWMFTCTATFSGPGTFTNVAVGHGSFTVNGVTKDVTVCPAGPAAGKFCDADETDTKSVTVCTPTVSGGK
jgi:uncharacterized repeat protein (TIGR01451 family)